ncbi:dedicator of cytokinesis protein 3 isoform X2 [Tribolium castaneum]|uniref:dedicator of cytokinesis protein 3 isoform X2 n=1 Tax=Tribolium castaneum TaxID=7070 RepID=UPI00046C1ECA|nr:PREDICTED: dedicator of cytokinesis protein 3 isoform X2 [Tribolium castaneum]|eukprot:XP_008198391.1 PREDICTED: dedicator of cytokinesis protein 3 isoform X2 [Tribolium castaneum]
MWIPTKTKKYGVAIYNWKGDTRFGLPLEIGETVQILEESQGWYRGFSTKNRSIKGIFPQSYIHLKPCKVDNEGLFESVVPLEDPVVREVTLVLREWGDIWKKLYVQREHYKFETVGKVMRDLLEWRRQLVSGTLTHDQTRELKMKIIAKIDWGNKKLGLDLVPRQGAQMIDPDSMSVVELYHFHVSSAENSQGLSARGTIKKKEPKKTLTHHLYFCMRDFGHHIGEDTEIYFSLYDASKQKYISERFLVKISKEGFSNYVEKLHSNCTVFTDLGNSDLSRDIYLVAHVMRIGKMIYSDNKKTEKNAVLLQQVFKRPHGVAVHNLGEYLMPKEGDSEEKELNLKVYQGEEKDFHQLHEFIIRQSGKYNALACAPNYGILTSVKMLHGGLNHIKEENAMLFKNVSLTSKLGFPDVIMPGDVRNDLYLILEKGEFERGGKSTGKNIEVSIVVLDSEKNVIRNCLWGASGQDGASEYNSMIIYHHNSPAWAENVRLTLPIDKFAGAHVRLEYRHCSTREKNDKKLFGFSFIRLMDKDGAAVQDGQHELYIYKCEDPQKLENCGYLSLPAFSKDLEGNHDSVGQFSRSHKEVVFVRTLLCSTKLTQNVDLLALLRWKSHPEKIQDSLQRVLRLGDEELIKFLQDVLDALFALFSTEDGNSTAYSGLVFHVLVSIFNLLDGSKYQHFKPVLDAYIKDHFAAALVYKGLLTSVQHCADWVLSFDKQEPIQKCYKSLEYIFKLIIQSRLLFSRATCGQYEDSFRRDLYSVFSSLNKMLTVNDPHIINTQVALLLSISAVYEQLIEVLPTIEVTKLAATLLDAIPKDLPVLLVQAKLSCIKNLVTSKLFQDDESRNILLANACKHLRAQLHRREELKLCTDILGEILGFLFKQRKQFEGQGKINNCIHHDVETLCINILDILVQAVLTTIDFKDVKDGKILGCLVACLIGILQLLDEFHYKRLWEVLMGPGLDRKPLKDFLLRVFLVFRNLVRLEVFPPDWLVMKMVVNNVMLKSLQELAQPLAFKFLDSRSGYFDKELWTDYFNLAVDYLTQKPLQLEHFSEVKREKIIEKYGDMRVLMGFQILSMWSQLGECKLHFIPSMVGPFLKVTLVPEIELRKATLHIFFDMMECEQRARGNFRQVESELIDKLDILISENKGDDEYRRLFNTILLDRVQSEDLAWKESGAAFISSITRLLERLLDYRSVIEGDENRDKRMSCTFNLLNFYKNEFNRKEMYLRYIYKLHDLHLSAENYTEAAFTMKLYADQLTWSSTTLVADNHFPNFTECQVKEKLYRQIINYFDKGKCWEKGIPLLKELATLYEVQFFDYKALSDILKYQAKFYDNILTQLRPEPEYFRVGFYGLSFPLFVRNKQFVYRGLEYERIGAFTQRLQTEFPSAQILMKNTPPDDSIVNSEGQFIQICNVKPIPEPNPITLATDIPEKISRFYHYNDVKRFQCDRPVHKGIIDKENEIKTLWIERMTLEIENPLPGILRWFEVINRHTDEIPPVKYACETMQSVELELRQLITTYTIEPKRNLNPLTMRLQGIIDANVQGGISKYQQAFFTQEFAKLCPEHMTYVYTLKNLILDAMQVIEEGLELHGRLAPAGVVPLHHRLLERFAQLKESLGALSKIKRQIPDSIVNTPLPPLPIDKRLMVVENGHHRPGNYDYLSEHRTLETDDIYTKPMENERPLRENLTLPMATTTAPPIPQRELRPRSQGFTNNFSEAQTPTRLDYNTSSLPLMKTRNSDSYDIPLPPKPTHSRERSLTKPPSPRLLRHASMTPTDGTSPLRNSWSDSGVEEAPPLPPRSHTPDKRLGFSEPPPNIPKRGQKKSLVGAAETECELTPDSLRDSGISMSENSNLNNLNNTCYEDFDLKGHQQEMNISSSPFEGSPKLENPPPIPPKASLSSSLEAAREAEAATPDSDKEKSPS